MTVPLVCQNSVSSASPGRDRSCRGYSVVELLIVVAIIVTILGIAIPIYTTAIDVARTTRAIGDIRTLEKEIMLYMLSNKKLPSTLDELGRGQFADPWGNPYEYASFVDPKGKGMRKNRFLHPLNTDYDLYSMGKDGDSDLPLTAQVSRDDVLRANNGSFVGLATDY
jgi:general secretion pathway protein G